MVMVYPPFKGISERLVFGRHVKMRQVPRVSAMVIYDRVWPRRPVLVAGSQPMFLQSRADNEMKSPLVKEVLLSVEARVRAIVVSGWPVASFSNHANCLGIAPRR